MHRFNLAAVLLLGACSHGSSKPQPELTAPCRGLDRADVPEATEQFDERDHIAFLPDSRLLHGDDHDVLVSRAEWLKGQPGHGLLVRGLTGHEADAYEVNLARQRVERVAAFLIRQGVPGSSVRRETTATSNHNAVVLDRVQPAQLGVIVQARSC